VDTVSLSFSVTPQVAQRALILAGIHGRSVEEELRVSFAVHDAASTLSWLTSPEGMAETGTEHPAAVAGVRDDLADLTGRAYRVPVAAGRRDKSNDGDALTD
jgi:hypothetical protein